MIVMSSSNENDSDDEVMEDEAADDMDWTGKDDSDNNSIIAIYNMNLRTQMSHLTFHSVRALYSS